MKKNTVRLLLLVIVINLLLTGCTQDDISNVATTSGETTPSDAETNALVDESYYRIWEEDGLFSFAIYDKEKNVVQLSEKRTKQPDITMISDNILCVTEQAGTGIATCSTYYYDVENNRLSDVYQAVLNQANGLVVYAEYNKIIICDIFGDNEFHQEIIDFSEPFSHAAFPFVGAELVDNATAICVTYLAGEEYTEISEIFKLEIG